MAEKKLNIVDLKHARLSWPTILEDCLDEKIRDLFLKRKKAVDMYIDGFKIDDISIQTNICRVSISKLVEKCSMKSEDTGEDIGYVALLPYKRIKKYNRDTDTVGNSVGLSGAFQKLLKDYPQLVDFIYNNYFGKKEESLEKNMTPTILHRKLLAEYKKLGVESYEYPFNTTNKGKISLMKYLKKIEEKYTCNAILRQNKDVIQKYNSTGFGKKYSSNPVAPFAVVQLDGHIVDMLYTVETENKHGEVTRTTATRAWLIAIVDVATRVILGYSLSQHENYNQTDVLLAIKDAIMPREKINFTIPGFSYPENGGFHSLALPSLEWTLFDSIMLDNAKAHLAKDVVNKLVEKLKCSVNFGSVATPETRGIIERMFKTLEENGYHRIASTTGSSPKDLKRKNAEKNAIKYEISFNDIEQLTEYLITIYNNSPHSALDNESPLQRLERRINELGMQPCIADSFEREAANNLTNFLVTRTIRGGYKQGKRPYISYLGVEYRNNIVPLSMSLVSQNILIEINPQDISFVKAYLEDGSELGVLSATGEWGRKAHSIKTRKQALHFSKENANKNELFYAPISEFEENLRQRAKSSRRAVTRVEILQKEQSTSKASTNILVESNNESGKHIDNNNDISKESYSPEIEKLLLSMSIEEAFEKGLI